MANKLMQMNQWRKQLSSKGVNAPIGMSYDELARLAQKHLGASAAKKGGCGCNSKSGKCGCDNRARRQTRRFLFGQF